MSVNVRRSSSCSMNISPRKRQAGPAAMQDNARQGFWSGGCAVWPCDCRRRKQRGAKAKKRLAIDPIEAEVMRLMFRLLAEGDGTSGLRA
jgi:hypothetical protein